jgi:hypothetical protein
MPRATLSDVHVNALLTNILVGWMQRMDAFVSTNVFPVVPVTKRSDQYAEFDRDDFLRIAARERKPGTPAAVGGFDVDTTATYSVTRYDVAYKLPDDIRNNQDVPISLERGGMRWIAQQLRMLFDKIWADAYFKVSVWDGDQTGVSSSPSTDQFLQFDQSGSQPIETIRKQMTDMEEKTGYRPNRLVLGSHTWRIIQDHTDLLDRIKQVQRGIMTSDILASVLELEKVVIARSTETTSRKAAGTTTTAYQVDGRAMALYYAAPSPQIDMPSAGYTFSWTGLGPGPEGQRVKQWRDERVESDMFEGAMALDHKVVAGALGRFFATAVGATA